MRPRDEVDVVSGVELLAHVTAEQVSRAPRAQSPSRHILGIRPEQIAHGAVVRHLLLPVDGPYLVHGGDRRGQPAVHAQNAVVDQRGEGEVIEDVGAVAPHVDTAILAQALVVKAVHLRDLPTLVVTAD